MLMRRSQVNRTSLRRSTSICRLIQYVSEFLRHKISFLSPYYRRVVLENSNVEKLASNQYLLVQSCAKADRYDTDDASPRELYALLVPESTMCAVQSSWRRHQRAAVVDRDAHAHRTAALYGM